MKGYRWAHIQINELQSWLLELGEQSRDLLIEAAEASLEENKEEFDHEQKTKTFEKPAPYEFRNQPEEVRNHALQLLHSLRTQVKFMLPKRQNRVRENLLEILRGKKSRGFLNNSRRIVHHCVSEPPNTSTRRKHKALVRFEEKLRQLEVMLPTEEQIHGCNISREHIRLVKSVIMEHLNALGMSNGQIEKALQTQPLKKTPSEDPDRGAKSLLRILHVQQEKDNGKRSKKTGGKGKIQRGHERAQKKRRARVLRYEKHKRHLKRGGGKGNLPEKLEG